MATWFWWWVIRIRHNDCGEGRVSVVTGEGAARRRVVVPVLRGDRVDDVLRSRLRAIRDELELVGVFPPEVAAEAAAAVAKAPLPSVDLTGIPFVTIDPEGSTDLDQALFIERRDGGYRVHYAIADVPAFVRPGGAVDAQARRRGQTIYAPEGRIPLHPMAISEDAASLLEGTLRGAFVWSLELSSDGAVTAVDLRRARVRSTRRYSYVEAQQLLEGGSPPLWLILLREVGMLRQTLEGARGGASLNRPDEEIQFVDGAYTLVRRRGLPVEGWNAQLSLMTGMAAATIMLEGGIGILRTMPQPSSEVLDRFRAQVAALGCPWPEHQGYGQYLRGLDQNDPRSLAAIHAATSLFRGAGYTAFDGELPPETIQAAVAAPYAHTTAPLRRLVDRFVLVACAALVAGEPVPAWVREALPTLPALMEASDAVASRLDRASVDAIEAALLSARVGEVFDAVVIAAKDGDGVIQLAEPVVTASIRGDVVAGQSVRAILITADIASGTVAFILA
ncbi:MAG: RNB domain-containing ribonuclease [Rhodoglobus sp.]